MGLRKYFIERGASLKAEADGPYSDAEMAEIDALGLRPVGG